MCYRWTIFAGHSYLEKDVSINREDVPRDHWGLRRLQRHIVRRNCEQIESLADPWFERDRIAIPI